MITEVYQRGIQPKRGKDRKIRDKPQSNYKGSLFYINILAECRDENDRHPLYQRKATGSKGVTPLCYELLDYVGILLSRLTRLCSSC
jgi:hypothetical protein